MKRILVLVFAFAVVPAIAQQQQLFIEPQQSASLFNAPISIGAVNSLKNVLAVASADKVVKIIEAQTLKERVALSGITSRVTALLFGADGMTLLTGLADGRVVLWNATNGSLMKILSPHSASVVAIELESASSLFSVGFDRAVKFTDLNSGNSLGSLPNSAEELTALALAPNGKSFALATATGLVRVHTMTQLLSPRQVNTGPDRITRIIFDPSGQNLFAGMVSGTIYHFETSTWTLKSTLAAHKGTINSLSTDPKGRWIVSAASDSMIRVYAIPSMTLLAEWNNGGGSVAFASFISNGLLLTGNSKGEVKSWRVLEAPPDTASPVVTILTPRQMADDAPSKWYGTEIQVEGLIGDESKIKEVMVNGVPTTIQDATERERASAPHASVVAKFVATVPLQKPGLNSIELKAIDQYGNTAQHVMQVQRLSRDEAIEIVSPENNTETDKLSIQLQVKTWTDISGYSVSVNMVEMAESRGVKRAHGSTLSEEVPLMAGYNQVQITATATTGERFTKTTGITRKVGTLPPAPTTFSSKSASKERSVGPQRWAVVVGISAYANSGVPSLTYADRDARAYADFLRTEGGGGFDDDHMRVLINQDATIANIRDALINFLSQAIDMDLVMIYFAGHGAPEPARLNNLYLLAHDTDPNLLGTTAFPMWQIQDVLARYISAKRIVVLSDACHSGGISVNYATRGLGVTESNLINQYLSDLSRSKEGVVVFTASAAGEVSQEFPDLGHGVFTYYLLEGLKGAADLNNDYTVTVNEAMQYVEEQVKRKTRGAQNPTRSQTSYDKDLTLSVLPH